MLIMLLLLTYLGRLMREPKPFVVGISWVVECAEQRKRVEEDNFIVDLEGLNVAGTNKVSYIFSHCNLEH